MQSLINISDLLIIGLAVIVIVCNIEKLIKRESMDKFDWIQMGVSISYLICYALIKIV